MSVRAEAEAFRQAQVFAGCDPAHLQVIAFSCEKEEFDDGGVIIKEGKAGDAGYLILRGAAKVTKRFDDGAREVATLKAGAFAGELGMIAAVPYNVTVTASGRVLAARVSRQLFMRVASEFPDFGQKVHAALGQRLAATVSELKSVKGLFDQAGAFSRR